MYDWSRYIVPSFNMYEWAWCIFHSSLNWLLRFILFVRSFNDIETWLVILSFCFQFCFLRLLTIVCSLGVQLFEMCMIRWFQRLGWESIIFCMRAHLNANAPDLGLFNWYSKFNASILLENPLIFNIILHGACLRVDNVGFDDRLCSRKRRVMSLENPTYVCDGD